MQKTIHDVKNFWNENPLFAGESKYKPGTKEFFEEHKEVYYEDCFAGKFDEHKFFPTKEPLENVLDLGCGVGFWSTEILQRKNVKKLYFADITNNALEITKKRLELYGLSGEESLQNAEDMSFPDNYFDFVNCQGVIHHTPNTDQAVKEIARVLKSDGIAHISVYYRNFILQKWKYISFIGGFISKLNGGLKGRGRENIFKTKDINEITRLYDGEENPIGKSYTKKEILDMVSPYFHVYESFIFFFPARALPFKIPKFVHRFLAKYFGFMIFLKLTRR